MKKDICLAASIGFFIAVCVIIIDHTGNIQRLSDIPFLALSIFVFPILAALALYVALLLKTKIYIALQGTKFLMVGASNTFLDLTVLNVLIALSGITAGVGFSLFKGISFIAAVINSYFWNKHWTFKKKKGVEQNLAQQGKEFAQFLAVSGIGFLLNVGSASLVVNLIDPRFGISERSWPTVAALVGTLLVLTWNFLGYKLIVFRK